MVTGTFDVARVPVLETFSQAQEQGRGVSSLLALIHPDPMVGAI